MKTARFDTVDHLDTIEAAVAYLSFAVHSAHDDDPLYIIHAALTVARAQERYQLIPEEGDPDEPIED